MLTSISHRTCSAAKRLPIVIAPFRHRHINMSASSPLYDLKVTTIKGEEVDFGSVASGKVALVVNVASKCGFTSQYQGLETVYQMFKDRGFTVLGFPCNQFGGQEPGTEKEIEEFVCTRFKATFPLFAKVDVTGDGAHPLFKALGKAKPGLLGREAPYWNFTFFLLDRAGNVVERYAPTTTAESITADIEKLL